MRNQNSYKNSLIYLLDLDVFIPSRNTYLNPNKKIETLIQKYPNETYEFSTLEYEYNPNRTEIQIRIRRYPKLVKYANVFIYVKVI